KAKAFVRALKTSFQPALAVVGREPADEEDDGDAGCGEEAVVGDRVGGRLAAVVGDEPDGRRPRDPAGRIPEKEIQPVHSPEPGDPRGGEPTEGGERTGRGT